MSRHAVTLAAAFLICASTASAQTLSLDEAVALALTHNRTLQNAALEVENAEREVANARTRRYPTFDVETQAAQLLTPVDVRFGDTTITTPRRASLYLSAQATQPISQLFELGLAVRLGAANVDFEKEKLRGARLALVHNVKRQYYAIVQARSELETVEHRIQLLEQVQQEMSSRVLQRVALKSDGLEVDTRLARTQLARVTLRHTLETQKEQLNLLLGRDSQTPFDVAAADGVAPVQAPLDAARTQALASRPDLRQARVQVQKAELARRIAAADALPDVGVAFSYLSPLNIEGAPRNIATVAVQVTWEPFDWGRKARTVAARAAAVTQARNAVADGEQRAIAEVNAGYRALERAHAQLRVAGLAQDTAREAARVRTTQMMAQAALASDVLQADAAVADANDEYRKALVALWDARAAVEHAIGEEQ